ncbi:hypothetical protein NP493_1280g00011 [Ridgeia piscesae]|uniref:Uncharacterized protein n=1 Tax=Ridgeia piscesae TaxID=27915 RepID=A0AAD9K920_RIDPI|nr:hypothetical protein NP493_1280g00011 [Ridgeia piscesae]
MADVLYSMELWKASLKTIEGNFGTGVTSYFQFLKWLFLFNIPTFLIIFFFVIVPQLLWHDWFKRTELYFGSYTNHTVNLIGDARYSMRFAYLLTCAGFYVITLLVLAYSQSNQLYYVAKVLCGWDFTVTEEATCISHHTALSKELQEYLAAFLKVKKHKTCQQWCGMIFLRLVINIAVVAALAGGNFLKDITTPLVISAINLIVPFIFSYLASVENYHNPWVDIFLTMLR